MCSQIYSFIFFGKEGVILMGTSPSSFLHTPQSIEAPLWTPNCKIKTNVLLYGSPFQCLRHGSWSFGKWYGLKLGCYWNTLRNDLGDNLGLRKKKQKNPSLISVAHPSYWLHETFISKTVGFIIFGFFFLGDGSIKEAHHPQTNHFGCTPTTNIKGTHSIYPTFPLVG